MSLRLAHCPVIFKQPNNDMKIKVNPTKSGLDFFRPGSLGVNDRAGVPITVQRFNDSTIPTSLLSNRLVTLSNPLVTVSNR